MIPVVDCTHGIISQKERIYEALTKVGFVYLINHGLDEKSIDHAFSSSKKFFNLPLDEKQKYNKSDNIKSKTGYVGIGVETLNYSVKSTEIRESVNFSPNDGSGVDFDPSKISEIGPLMKPFLKELNNKALEILEALADVLEFDKQWFLDQHRVYEKPSYTSIRFLYYPIVPDDIRNGSERCGDHTDYGSITLLLQDEVGGLEVMNRQGEYVPVKPIENAILVNSGELLEKWTGGLIKATRHRVRTPPDAALRKKVRYSIAYFMHPMHETIVKPMAGDLMKYAPVKTEENTLKFLMATFTN
uniref:Fe2OG dioxygenase domain-containing protein n=1 Tax=Acrobeloides nanus TaxID=290746 RepID=A0A914DI57_9BILA